MSLPKYPEYKDSGVEWLGEVPANWTTPPLYLRYRVELGKMLDAAKMSGESLVPYLRNVDVQWNRINFDDLPSMDIAEEELHRFTVREGDLLVCEGGEVGRAAIVPPIDEVIGFQKALHRLRSRSKDEDPGFMYYTLAATSSRGVFSTGGLSTIAHLTGEQLRKYRFAKPSLVEQTAIAAFLDRETAKIDALVAEQEKLLTLLAEKRQATISHAVTKGLNPDAPMKDSGVKWLGEVPRHWRTCPLKLLGRIGNGSTPSRDNPDYWAEEGFPWLNSSVVNHDEVTEAQQFVTPLALKECHLPIVVPPALLVGITGQGKTRGMATRLAFTATVNQHVAYIKPDESTLASPYLLCVLESAYKHLRTESDGAGSTKGAITCEQLGRLRIPLPPIAEQHAISAFLDTETTKLDSLKLESERAIALLKERRTALISAAVTGKIDVRREAAQPIVPPCL